MITRLPVTTVIGHVHMYRCNSDEVFEYGGVDSPILIHHTLDKKFKVVLTIHSWLIFNEHGYENWDNNVDC